MNLIHRGMSIRYRRGIFFLLSLLLEISHSTRMELPEELRLISNSYGGIARKILESMGEYYKIGSGEANSENSECTEEIVYMMAEGAVGNLLGYSGKGMNDLGDWEGCTSQNDTRYILLNVMHLPTTAQIGICGPRKCKVENYDTIKDSLAPTLYKVLKYLLPDADWKWMSVTPQQIIFIDPMQMKESDGTPGAGFVITILIYISIILMGIIGYIYNENSSPETLAQQTKKNRIMRCFSPAEHAHSIFASNPNVDENLMILDGLRTLAMWWVIIGNVFNTIIKLAPISNANYVYQFMTTFKYAIFYNASYAIDIFFFLGAFLLTYLFLKQIRALRGKISPGMIGLMYLHRLIRLYPLIFFSLFFYTAILPSLGTYPNSHILYHAQDECIVQWPFDIFWLSNFRGESGACMSWVWYLANELQFYIIAPLLLLLYFKWPKWGILLIIFMMIGSIVIQIALSVSMNMNPSTMIINNDYLTFYFTQPYVRINPYLIGMLMGIVYTSWHFQEYNSYTNILRILRKHWWVRGIIYFTGIFIMFWIIQGMYFINTGVRDKHAISNTMYTSFGRSLFIIALILFMFCSMIGKERWLNFLFARPFFIPLAKLSYGAYMVHIPFVTFYLMQEAKTYYFEESTSVMQFLSYLTVSYICSFSVYVFLEGPIFALEKEFLLPKEEGENKGHELDDQLDDDQISLHSIPRAQRNVQIEGFSDEDDDEETKKDRSSIAKIPGLTQYWGGSIQDKQ